MKTFFLKYAKEIRRSAVVSLLISWTILCAALTIFFGNMSDFTFNFSELMGPLVAGFTILSVFLFFFQVIFRFFGEKTFTIVNLIFFAGGVYLFLQANYLVWNLGTLLGEEFWWDWEKHGTYTIIELVCMVVLVICFVACRKWISKNVMRLSVLILLIALTNPVSLMLFAPNESDFSFKNYTIDQTNEFRFSKERNVILLILDAYPNVLLDVVEKQHPGTLNAFHDFTRYERFLCEYSYTWYAVPAMLTGVQIPRTCTGEQHNKYINEIFYTDKSVPKKLRDMDFLVETYAPLAPTLCYDKALFTNILHKTECKSESILTSSRHKYSVQTFGDAIIMRLTPTRVKGTIVRYLDSLKHGCAKQLKEPACYFKDSEFYSSFPKNMTVGDAKNVFKYYHLSGVHVPYSMTNGDDTKTGYITQGKICLEKMALFLQKLKELGIYDSSLIIIAGDHGRQEKFYGLTDLPDGMNPMLLVKMPRDQRKTMESNNEVFPQTEFASAMISAIQKYPGNQPFFQPSEAEKKIYADKWEQFSHVEAVMKWVHQKTILALSENPVPEPASFGTETTCYANHVYIKEDKFVVGLLHVPPEIRGKDVYCYGEDSQGNYVGGNLLKAYPGDGRPLCCAFEIGISADVPDGDYKMLFRYQINGKWFYNTLPQTIRKQGEKIMFVEGGSSK